MISFCFQLVPKTASWFYLPPINPPKKLVKQSEHEFNPFLCHQGIYFTFHSFTRFFVFVRVVWVHLHVMPQVWLETGNVRASWLLYKCARTELQNVADFTDISMKKQ